MRCESRKRLQPVVASDTTLAVVVFVLFLRTTSYSVHASDGIVSNNWQCANIGQQLLFERATVEQIYVAISLCEGLVHPMDSGIGGGFQALIYDNRSTRYLMSREYSPWQRDFMRRPFLFGNSIGVPSVLAGYAKLLGVDRCVSRNGYVRKPCRFEANCSLPAYDIDEGCLRDILSGQSASGLRKRETGVPYPRVFEDVIKLAQNGFEVSRTLRTVLDKSDQLPYFLHPTSNPSKINNLALANFLGFLAYNPIRLLDPYYVWTKRHVRDDLNTTLIMLNDVRSYRSHLTDFDFFTYRASWRRSLSFAFTYANQSYRFSTMPKPAGGETVAFFFRMVLTLLDSVPFARLSDVQLSTLFVLFSKWSFAVKLYFRQVSRKMRDRLINDEAPYIARQLIADISIRRDENSLADYLVHETPGIPHVFGRVSLPPVVVFQVRTRKRSDTNGAAFTSLLNNVTKTAKTSLSPDPASSNFSLFYTSDRDRRKNDDRDDSDEMTDHDRNHSLLFSDALSSIHRVRGDQHAMMCDGDDEETRAENNELKELLGSPFPACSPVSLLQNDDIVNVPVDAASRRHHRLPSTSSTAAHPDVKILLDGDFEIGGDQQRLNNRVANDYQVDVERMNEELERIVVPREERYENNEYDDNDDVLASLQLLRDSHDNHLDGYPDSPHGTTNVVVKKGNRCIVATSSINHSFGSLVFSQNLGLPYNNVLRDFTPHNWFLRQPKRRRASTKKRKTKLSPSSASSVSSKSSSTNRTRRSTSTKRSNVIAFANHPRPHSVPQSSMACTIVWNVKTGNPVFAIGAAGGFKITSAVFNILWNYFVLGDSLEKSFSRLRLVTKLNYKTRSTEIWYEFPIESPFYTRLLREKSLIYSNQLRYEDFTYLSTASRIVDYPRLAYTPRFFFEHRQALNVKYIFEAGYSAATGCSTMRHSKLTCNYDRRRGGKTYVRL